MNLTIGFSTGSLFQTSLNLQEKLAVIRETGCNAAELGCIRLKEFYADEIYKLTTHDFEDFEYVSLHAPTDLTYRDDQETRKALTHIEEINSIRQLNLVVLHPDTVEDFSVFNNVSFPVAFENMDNRKNFGKTPKDVGQTLAHNKNFTMVLDVNHVYSNDPTMNLARWFYSLFRNKIIQIHLSGYVKYHEAIYQTKQVDIIQAIEDFDVPIIIESVVSKSEIKKERDFILEHIEQLRRQ